MDNPQLLRRLRTAGLILTAVYVFFTEWTGAALFRSLQAFPPWVAVQVRRVKKRARKRRSIRRPALGPARAIVPPALQTQTRQQATALLVALEMAAQGRGPFDFR